MRALHKVGDHAQDLQARDIVGQAQTGTGKTMSIEAGIKDSESMLEVARQFGVPVLMQSVNHAYYEMALQRGGFKDRPWDGEMLKLWEGLIGKPIRFD